MSEEATCDREGAMDFMQDSFYSSIAYQLR
jgi:hypothetical protein